RLCRWRRRGRRRRGLRDRQRRSNQTSGGAEYEKALHFYLLPEPGPPLQRGGITPVPALALRFSNLPLAHALEASSVRRDNRLRRSSMSDNFVIPVPAEWAKKAYVDDVGYRAMHAAALADPEAFWGKHGQRLDWIKPYTKV